MSARAVVSSESLSGVGDPLPGWFIHVGVGKRPQFLSIGLHESYIGLPLVMTTGFPQRECLKRGRGQCTF